MFIMRQKNHILSVFTKNNKNQRYIDKKKEEKKDEKEY